MCHDKQDRFLLTQISKGDRKAMRGIYDAYSDSIFRFVKSWLADPFEASDIMHETMMEVWKSAGRFAERSTVKTWIFSIARNKAIDRNRKAVRLVLQDPDPNLEDEAPNPEAVTGAFQNAQQVRACIEGLSPPHKMAIHLAFYEDLTYREIAELENCPTGTIKTRILHAKKLLMRCLAQQP